MQNDLLPRKIYGAAYDKPFKKVFSDKNTFILFMKDVFDEKVTEFHYIDKELSKDNKNRTYGICDMMVEAKDKIVILEMQNQKKGKFEQRCFAYLSKVFLDEWKKQDSNIKNITICWILNYQYSMEELLEFRLLKKILKLEFGNLITIKLWSLHVNHKRKANKKWASIFNVNKKHLRILGKEEKYKKAVENIKEYNLDEKEYSVLRGERKMWTKEDEARIDWLCGYDEGDKNGERRGISIGEERGEKRGILTGKLETAQNLIKKGIDLSIVLEVTGLKENQILNSNKSSRITEKC